jgi:hypothetical protein
MILLLVPSKMDDPTISTQWDGSSHY